MAVQHLHRRLRVCVILAALVGCASDHLPPQADATSDAAVAGAIEAGVDDATAPPAGNTSEMETGEEQAAAANDASNQVPTESGGPGDGGEASQRLPADVSALLDSYNIVWTSPSTGSQGSMPIGNGDISANVWVENGGDLVLYIGKSDAWSEGTRLLKLGRVRVTLSPNPFTGSSLSNFSQTLKLREGEIDIGAGATGQRIDLRVWIDWNRPVLRIEAIGDHPFTLQSRAEIWRTTTLTVLPTDPIASSFRGVMNGPMAPSESPDVVLSRPGEVAWYHRNDTSLYPAILKAENLVGFDATHPDPYLGRTFGAIMKGAGLTNIDAATLRSASPASTFTVSVYPYTAQTPTATEWEAQANALVGQVDATGIETQRLDHRKAWDVFWNRSWVFASGDADAVTVTRGYQLQRFIEACNGRGKSPIKYNGGTFTFDYSGQNGDYRRWGPGIWNQNTRHLYWPLLASGDFDLMMPWFDFYKGALGLQTDVTAKYYNHGGAFFPETMNFFGLYLADDWGFNNAGTVSNNRFVRYHYQGALEVLAMMLDYHDYTGDDAFGASYIVPFATQIIRFFDQHWPRVSGKIQFYPANAIEEYWDCTNPTDYIAGLRYTIPRLAGLPQSLTTQALRDEWANCYAALPPLPMDATGTSIKPAEVYGATHNFENPELYAIFPYKLYGLGRPGLSIALNTFNARINKGPTCWSQDPIQAPLLGLSDLARTYVVANFTPDPASRFPAFWPSRHDYLPDLDNGGAGMTGLQNMLVQTVGNRIFALPAWPATWDVDFKLHAPAGTTVRLKYQNRAVTLVDVIPASRAADVLTGQVPDAGP